MQESSHRVKLLWEAAETSQKRRLLDPGLGGTQSDDRLFGGSDREPDPFSTLLLCGERIYVEDFPLGASVNYPFFGEYALHNTSENHKNLHLTAVALVL